MDFDSRAFRDALGSFPTGVAVVAINEGASPKDVVARARRVVATDCRPNQAELKQLFG